MGQQLPWVGDVLAPDEMIIIQVSIPLFYACLCIYTEKPKCKPGNKTDPQITSCLIGRAGFEAKSAQAFPNTLYNESLYNITLQPISRSP